MSDFDCTTLVRKTLPLIQVDIDTGPVGRISLETKREYARHIAGSPGFNQELAAGVAALLTWALDGYVPVYNKGKLL